MKKLVLLLIIGVLITASCSNDSEADLTAEIVDNMKQMQDLVNTKGKGTYDMVWIVNKAIVDTATLSTECDSKYIVISHLPDTYLFHDNLGKYSFNYDIIKDYQPSYGHTAALRHSRAALPRLSPGFPSRGSGLSKRQESLASLPAF